MPDEAILIEGLTKRYKDVEALRGLSLAVPRGSVCGFLGRNGAGKTTTIRILIGAAHKDAGAIRVLGYDASNLVENVEARKRIGFVSEHKELYPYMTVGEVIRFTRRFFPNWSADIESRCLRRFELQINRKITALSKGMHTKLMLLLALSRAADLLVLDEPTEGLDPVAVEEVLQAVVSYAAEREATVFFSSHELTEVERIADRVIIIDAGRAVLSGQLDDMRANYRSVNLVFRDEPLHADLRMPGVEHVDCTGRSATLLVSANVDAVVENAKARRAVSVEVFPVSLKDIFLGVVRGGRL